MEKIPKKQEETIHEIPALWHQLTPLQREQIAVVVLRILRQWRAHAQLQEAENEPVKMGI